MGGLDCKLMIVVQSGDQSELLGHTYETLQEVKEEIRKKSGLMLSEIVMKHVTLSVRGDEGRANASAILVGTHDDGESRTKYFAAACRSASLVAAILYKRQRSCEMRVTGSIEV